MAHSNIKLQNVAEVVGDLKHIYAKGQEFVRWIAVGLTYLFFILSVVLWSRIGFDIPDDWEGVVAFGVVGVEYVLANAFLTRHTGFQWQGWGTEGEIVFLGFFPILWIVSGYLLYMLSGEFSGLFFYPVFVIVWLAGKRLYERLTGLAVEEERQKKTEQIIPSVGMWFPTEKRSDEPMMTKDAFIRKVRTDLFPHLDDNKLKNRKRMTWVLSIALAVLWAVLAYYFYRQGTIVDEGPTWVLIGILFGGPFSLYLFYSGFKEKHVSKTKKKLFQWLNIPLMGFFGTEEEQIPEDRMEKLKEICFLFNRINTGKGIFSAFKKASALSDLLAVELEKDAFFCTETGLAFEKEKARVYEGELTIPIGNRDVVLFDGILIEIKLNRTFSSPIVFTKRAWFHWEKGLAQVRFQRKDAYFDVFAWSEQEAKNLYYQGVTNKLRRIDDIFKVDKIAASFFQDKLYIALYTEKDVFEPIGSRFKDVRYYEQRNNELARKSVINLNFFLAHREEILAMKEQVQMIKELLAA